MFPEWAVQWIFGGLVSIVMWFTAQTLRKVDRNQTDLSSRLSTVEKDLSRVEGVCNVRHGAPPSIRG
ncbi:MAG: hypothetical protein KKD73_01685 [Proteobacteria bacterium]|nr:hypothetical protein [Pseudomonadota bacterium]MBU1640082.1 hypothetical protein [Pseudomonadota bacterium]